MEKLSINDKFKGVDIARVVQLFDKPSFVDALVVLESETLSVEEMADVFASVAEEFNVSPDELDLAIEIIRDETR